MSWYVWVILALAAYIVYNKKDEMKKAFSKLKEWLQNSCKKDKQKLFSNYWLLQRGTWARWLILLVCAILGVVFVIVAFYGGWSRLWCIITNPKDCLSLPDKLENFVLLCLTLPTAIALWVFRNNDKRTDHENADINHSDAAAARGQTLESLKRDEFYRLIQIQRDDINNLLNEMISYRESSAKPYKEEKLKNLLDRSQQVFVKSDDQALRNSSVYKELSSRVNEFGKTLMDYEKLVHDCRVSNSYKRPYAPYVHQKIIELKVDSQVANFYKVGVYDVAVPPSGNDQ